MSAGPALQDVDLAAFAAELEDALVGSADTSAWLVPQAHEAIVLRAARGLLGSKHLAVGAPRTLGLIGDGPLAEAALAVHQTMFTGLRVRRGRDGLQRVCACDIVCVTEAPAERLALEWFSAGAHLDVLDPDWLADGLIAAAFVVGAGAHARGSLADLCAGRIGGRVGEELTVLIAPLSEPAPPSLAGRGAAESASR